jgi:hypothetical protein
MNKSIALLVTLSLVCSAGTALAERYTDLGEGFAITVPEKHYAEIVGPGFFYNSMGKNSQNYNLVFAINQKALQKVEKQKYTTKDFLKTYADVQLLERSKVDTKKCDSKLFKPENFLTYEKGLIPLDAIDKEELPGTYKLSSQEVGGKKYLCLDLETEVKTEANSKFTSKNTQEDSSSNEENSEVTSNNETGDADINLDNTPAKTAKKSSKDEAKPLKIHIAVTSANDRLYALISAIPIEDTAAKIDKELENHTAFKAKSIRKTLQDKADERNAEYNQVKTNFIKSFQTLTPQKPLPLLVSNNVLDYKMTLPKDWFYARIQDTAKEKQSDLLVALPMDYLPNLAKFTNKGANNNYQKIVQESLGIGLADTLTTNDPAYLLDNFHEALAIFSYKNSHEKPFESYLKDSDKTKKALDQFFTMLDKEKPLQGLLTINFAKRDLILTPAQGNINFYSNLNYKEKYNLNYDGRVIFTKDTIGIIGYVANGNQQQNPAILADIKNFKPLVAIQNRVTKQKLIPNKQITKSTKQTVDNKQTTTKK